MKCRTPEAPEETTAREHALLENLLLGANLSTDLFKAFAQSYTSALRRSGPTVAANERLTRGDGDMLIARLELEVEALRKKVKVMGDAWRDGG